MQLRYSFLLGTALTAPAVAADLNVSVEIPLLNVAAYHRPYVAFWIEDKDQKFVHNLAVWHQLKSKNNEGDKYIKDLRQWWRKSGRDQQMPLDGLSGATRAPGTHALSFNGAKAGLDRLPAGEYQLVVEAAREAGGRELLRVPFQWPAKSAQTAQAKGDSELGSVSVTVKP